MSIKQYFENSNFKFFNKDLKEVVGRDFESFGFLEELGEERKRFIPNIDFSDPKNYARYGLAGEYLSQSVERVKNLYPYDGSRKEKADYENKSTYLDLYVFDKKYPRTTGYGIFSSPSPNGWGTNTGTWDTDYGISSTPEYIYVFGGPKSGPSGEPLGGNLYNTSSMRASNLALNLSSSGFTTEMWIKKKGSLNAISTTTNEVLIEYWNNMSASADGKGVVRLELYDYANATVAPFRLKIISGSTESNFLLGDIALKNTLYSGSWTHIAVAYKSQTTAATASLYVGGELYHTTASSDHPHRDIKGTINACIGGLISGSIGAGKLSGSIDELRHWKTLRNGEEIERNFFKQVYGGTNTDTANTDLGVYFKFNEGITGNTTIDSTVLDFSGRISNGSWTGYTATSRNTGSAMIESSASLSEFKDPILYSSHPDYISLITEINSLTREHDLTNPSNIYFSLPDYIVEGDTEGGGELKKLVQVISSYFDTLHNQIEFLNKIKNIDYISGSSTSLLDPINISKRLLEERGLFMPDLFIESSILEDFSNTDGDRKFQLDLFKMKNLIYKNIYNNLTHIYKTKGTEKTVRNLLRCYGIDENLVKLNIYPNNFTFDLKDRRKISSRSKKFVDFSRKENKNAVIYNFSTSSAKPGFVTGSSGSVDVPLTMECEVFFPKITKNSDYFSSTGMQSSSIFGFTGVAAPDPSTNTREPPAASNNSVRIYAVNTSQNSEQQLTKFVLTSDAGNIPTLTTPYFSDVYENSKWIMAARFYSTASLTGTFNLLNTGSRGTRVEFVGYNSVGDTVINEFLMTGTLPQAYSGAFTGSKRAYIGATRTNVTGTVIQSANTRVGSLRLYYDYISNTDLKRHSFDSETYGTEGNYKQNYTMLSENLTGSEIDNTRPLAQHWRFDGITATSQRFLDFSSGSNADFGVASQFKAMYKNYGISSSFFGSNKGNIVTTEFMADYQLTPPEVLNSDDMITIMSTDEDKFLSFGQRFTEYNILLEKSMYAGISDEMMQMFSTVTDFSNLIGEYVNRYRFNYKMIDHLRERFFEKVKNVPKVEKFLEFYKWIDTSISNVAFQLLPASSKLNLEHFTIIESHLLERNKYFNKFPTVKESTKWTFTITPPDTGIFPGGIINIGAEDVSVGSVLSQTPAQRGEVDAPTRTDGLETSEQRFGLNNSLNMPVNKLNIGFGTNIG